MQLINSTIATTTEELKQLMQHCIIHNLDGRVNLTFQPDGKIDVWQPKNMPVAESVGPVEAFTDLSDH